MIKQSKHTVELNAMVISAMSVGEYDRRLTLFTKERGKLSVFARGAKKRAVP